MSAKQAIKDKLQGSVTSYMLRCGGVVNIQVEKGLLLSVRVKKNLAKLQARAWLSHALCAPGQQIAKNEESAQDNHVFACNFVR